MKHRLINRSTFLLPYNEEREGWLHRMSEAGTKVDKYRGRTDKLGSHGPTGRQDMDMEWKWSERAKRR